MPADKPAEFNFQDEGGTVTALSAIYLSLACGFAIASNVIHFRSKRSYQWLWLVFAAGFAFLAFDELMQFHERFGRIMSNRIMPQEFFRNWNDAIVVMYGVIGLPVLVLLLPRLLRYRLVPEMFAAAFIFYLIHTLIDSTQEPPTVVSIMFEESAKLLCAAFLAIGSFVGFIGNTWQSFATNTVANDIAEPVDTDREVGRFEPEAPRLPLERVN